MQKQKGRTCELQVRPLGEIVIYKRLTEDPDGRKYLESSLGEGVWLGHARISSEVLIGTQNGGVRAWTEKES